MYPSSNLGVILTRVDNMGMDSHVTFVVKKEEWEEKKIGISEDLDFDSRSWVRDIFHDLMSNQPKKDLSEKEYSELSDAFKVIEEYGQKQYFLTYAQLTGKEFNDFVDNWLNEHMSSEEDEETVARFRQFLDETRNNMKTLVDTFGEKNVALRVFFEW